MEEYKLNGWLGPQEADKAFEQLQDQFIKFRIVGKSTDKAPAPVWRYAQRINNGENIKTWNQETGDCVSMGAAQALNYMQCADIAYFHKNQQLKLVFPPYIYGVSRTAKDCGNGQLGRSGGSLGSWAAVAMQKHGVLFEDDPNVPRYSGALADKWGYWGVPQEFYKEAADNLVKSAARISTIDEIREALINYHMCTIASSWGFTVGEKQGVKVYEKQGTWYHQMCLIAWRDDPFPAAFRLNSWGPDSTGATRDNEPGGGAWQSAESLAKELKTADPEVYALSAFDGFPSLDERRSYATV